MEVLENLKKKTDEQNSFILLPDYLTNNPTLLTTLESCTIQYPPASGRFVRVDSLKNSPKEYVEALNIAYAAFKPTPSKIEIISLPVPDPQLLDGYLTSQKDTYQSAETLPKAENYVNNGIVKGEPANMSVSKPSKCKFCNSPVVFIYVAKNQKWSPANYDEQTNNYHHITTTKTRRDGSEYTVNFPSWHRCIKNAVAEKAQAVEATNKLSQELKGTVAIQNLHRELCLTKENLADILRGNKCSFELNKLSQDELDHIIAGGIKNVRLFINIRLL